MLRLTGGIHKGRTLLTPSGDRTRPTQAKLRQALFNSIQGHISEAKVLDLFSGSGALGFEALSRGAASVTFVESSRTALKLIEKNAENLKVRDQTKILGELVEVAVKRLSREGGYDLVFADPPYSGGWETRLVTELFWKELLVPGGIFCLEWCPDQSLIKELPESMPPLVKIREKNYGDSVLTTYQRVQDLSPSTQ